jgi:hypothetical protein
VLHFYLAKAGPARRLCLWSAALTHETKCPQLTAAVEPDAQRFVVPWSDAALCLSAFDVKRTVDVDHVEGRGNPQRIRCLAATHHTNPEMSELFCEMRMV